MSEADKTRQKLLDSVQKTRAAAGAETPTQDEGAADKQGKPARARPSKKPTDGKAKPAAGDPYRSSNRVWPD